MSRRWHIGRDNWFLVIPALILGLAALWTVNRMYRAGDIRRAIEVVTTYRVEGRPELGEWLRQRGGDVGCGAEMVSRFYGTLDVTCVPADSGTAYEWRVHVGQRAFAPADDVTQGMMARYAPEVFAEEEGTGGAPETSTSGQEGDEE